MRGFYYGKDSYIDCQDQGGQHRKEELLSVRFVIHSSTYHGIEGTIYQIPPYEVEQKAY